MAVGAGVSRGSAVGVGASVGWGTDVAVGDGVAVGAVVAVGSSEPHATAVAIAMTPVKSNRAALRIRL